MHRKENGDVNKINQKKAFIRDGISYSSTLMKNIQETKGVNDESQEAVKVVEVHRETSVFFYLQGRLVVGRAIDVKVLINLKDSLKKAGIEGFKLHYLRGLNVLIAFDNETDASDLALNVNIWKDWFDPLDIWDGQTLAYERLAWLKFHGFPLHLVENKVFDDVASLFGKVVKGAQLSSLDWDLSTACVGVLVDSGARISGSAFLNWKNKKFKVWVLEELDDWVPDCFLKKYGRSRVLMIVKGKLIGSRRMSLIPIRKMKR
ncbi:hypothetical protein HanRHA438_Chr11g0510731 [Helianthus annuus]|uniref:DUF4283 domain-containing protein n=1 Tax=Helianthus annuus TaxID=4232 RepID=A0A9K3N0M6_HELAN|nr:hypothetical protein HanXRQr2_Chr11g0498101 [Helianthus annuus]KAJ0502085.1 hypothetical protein HanHA300_Chr11g0408671 [Helianthus annuus]KAJ0510053.1 hypothetical protein HanIR_Chr11g0536291 [Helianthus annuus]KAJ0518009.1 hypothetical protein HanHA89_Chr11g0432371 [Helianthus annuus]KAJ0686029.1 hypothetical protein HanLR1_Chr11g0409911 [Helianthus annuus]